MKQLDRRRGEDGIALMFAIVMVVLILGFLVVFTASSRTSRDERTTERGRMQSEVWSDAAGAAIAARLESGELGHRMVTATVNGKPGKLMMPALAGTTRAHGSSSCGPSFPLVTTGGGSGFYCIRPPAVGQPAGTGFLNLSPTDPEHGTVTFVVRAWGTVGAIRPIDVELRFGRESLSRYAVLSDAPITLDARAGGTLTLPAGARLHSNNTTNSQHGIYLRGNVSHTNAARMTATRSSGNRAVGNFNGAPACPNGNKCYASGVTVSFNSTYQAFNRVAKADPTASCPLNNAARYASGFRLCRIPYTQLFPAPVPGFMPMFAVDVGASCVTVSYTRFPLRTDSLSYPIVDDAMTPTPYGRASSYCPTSGGGALLFEGDVLLRGTRPAGTPPVTIMARRSQASGALQRVTLPNGTPAQVAEAASIYLVPSALGGSGAGATASPLGIVAEGGVYVPTRYATGNFTVHKASIIAAGAGFSLGPSFQRVAGDSGVVDEVGTEMVAGGIDPCHPQSGLPTAGTFTFQGTMASRQVPFLSYVRGCTRGYQRRNYQFDTELGWNPPPFFPAPDPWHLVDSRVFAT